MPRPKHEEDLTAGQDSFLDVITNIVGILIILVMVVGARVKQVVLTPAGEPSAAAVDLERELQRLDETVASSEEEIEALQAQAGEVAAAAELAADSRLELATAVSAARVELERRKQASDAARVAAAERSARRETLEAEIRQCTLDVEGLRHARATTQEVLAYPTPIGRTVNGEEIHFRIAGDRIAYIPLEELFELAKNRTQRSAGSITSMDARVES
ncbi:MAG: hypothetical protein EBR23_13275, partial [Planctomycetia bacterium]|nr:hypothetical protein [Planctomycetia bacterium]